MSLGITAVARDHNNDPKPIVASPDQRRVEIVRALLSGRPGDSVTLAELNYEIHTAWHIGLIAIGAGGKNVVQWLTAHYPNGLLTVLLDGTVCAWLGAPTVPAVKALEHLSTGRQVGFSLALGEPGKGLDGWRLTHDQARAASNLALYKSDILAWYADDRLLAAVLQNDTLLRSLTQKYLVPLRRQRDGGSVLRRTLRTYIDLHCNTTSTAHYLKVRRHTVENRLRTAETQFGCPLQECLSELDVALRLAALDCGAAIDPPKPRKVGL